MADVDWNSARLEVIEIVLKGWTALDLQIQHNPHDLPVRRWLPEPIAEALKQSPDLEELEDWLAGLLDTNFSLICEDDSCYHVARHLVEIERIINKKDKDKLIAYVQRLPQASGAGASIFEKADSDEESSDDENENESVNKEQKQNK